MRDLEKKEIRLYRGIFKFNTEIHMLLSTRVLDSSQTSDYLEPYRDIY